MKKTLLSVSACFLTLLGTAQTQLFFEDFEGGAGGFSLNTADQGGVVGTGGDNMWVVNSSYAGGTITSSICLAGNTVPIGTTPSQPGGISSANGGYLHILSQEAFADGGVLNANYALADNALCFFPASNFVKMTADISTTSYTNVTLSFWWLNQASQFATGQLYYSTDGGTTWTQKTGTNYYGQGTWVQQTLTDAAWDNQASLRFGIRFNNATDAGFSGSDPALSIDDFEIVGTAGTPCSNTTSSITETACFTYTVPSGDETYSTAGTMTVMDTIPNIGGCDSIITIALTINDVDTSVTAGVNSLTANSNLGTFQWLDCGNSYAVVNGATSNIYNGSTGNFAVEVTANGCVDTSSCYALTLSFDEYELGGLNIYPNPNNGSFAIDLTAFNQNQLLTITDMKGATIYTETVSSGTVAQYNLNLESGVYLINLMDAEGIIRRGRLVIE
ncbi:T9SS type A sorting domain-containing protein [Paracrocinitomix mangrovi]|uniref:T9SS type A sorting domain-containing protein n=1 Tax=Paracrocinitomix mangrovi TaxID=2862509 RepID=UPI001C8D21CE|nr:T9SS type A sorting domain-containing protein [Paracrocinitomix mangrovi]UKN02623.1 T9SS type A sorting domain-containing protein [Paracrocinitomix mangrovi]